MGKTWTSHAGTFKIGRFAVASYADKRVCGNWTHTDRRYVLVTETTKRGKTIDHGQHYTEFRGDYELRVLAKLGLITAHTDKKALRVTPYHDLREVTNLKGELRQYKIYIRSLAGVDKDYALTKNGVTAHGATIAECVKLWTTKKQIKSDEKARIEALANKGQLVTIGTASDLGFCDAGIDLFLHEAGLTRGGKYSAQGILVALESAPSTRETYPEEYRTIKALCHRMIVGSNCA